jgi:hypothetical protein
MSDMLFDEKTSWRDINRKSRIKNKNEIHFSRDIST